MHNRSDAIPAHPRVWIAGPVNEPCPADQLFDGHETKKATVVTVWRIIAECKKVIATKRVVGSGQAVDQDDAIAILNRRALTPNDVRPSRSRNRIDSDDVAAHRHSYRTA